MTLRAGLLVLAVLGACRSEPAPPPAEEKPAAVRSAPLAMIPDGGHSRVDKLLAESAAEPSPRPEAIAAFNSGFQEMDYRFLHHLTPEETGLAPVPPLPGDASEKGGLKCRKEGWEYLERHPRGDEGYAECCRRQGKSKTTTSDAGDRIIMVTRGDGYADSWDCYRWQPRRQTWSAYGEEELVDGFEFYLQKTYGPRKDESLALRAFYEGALYRLELERKRLALPAAG